MACYRAIGANRVESKIGKKLDAVAFEQFKHYRAHIIVKTWKRWARQQRKAVT